MDVTLPFNHTKQSALLGHLLLNDKFFKNSCSKIKPHWFLSDKHSRIYKLLLSYNNTYGVHPVPWELKNYREFLALDIKDREILYAFMDSSMEETNTYRLPALSVDLTDWLHSVILLDALKDSEKLFNNQNVKECHSRLMAAVNDVNNARFNNETEISFSGFREYMKKSEAERG